MSCCVVSVVMVDRIERCESDTSHECSAEFRIELRRKSGQTRLFPSLSLFFGGFVGNQTTTVNYQQHT